MKLIIVVGLCILLSLALVLADNETMFGVGDEQAFINMPVDYETGFLIGMVPHGGGGGFGGSSFVNYSVTVSQEITSYSVFVPVKVDISNRGNPFYSNMQLELVNPAGYVVQMTSFNAYLQSGANVIQQQLLMPSIVPGGNWSVRLVATDGGANESFIIKGPAEVKPAPFYLAPVGSGVLNFPSWMLWAFLIFIVFLIIIFGKKRRRKDDQTSQAH
jgi:hypothetical protein